MAPPFKLCLPSGKDWLWVLGLIVLGGGLGFGMNAVSGVGINLRIALDLDEPSAATAASNAPTAEAQAEADGGTDVESPTPGAGASAKKPARPRQHFSGQAMNRAALQTWLWNAVRVVLGFLFLLAASGKFRDPVKFMGGIDEYGIVHGWTLPLGAVVMPGIEWLSALLLLLALRTRAAAMLVGGMLLLFIAAMGSALSRHLELDCSCFDLMGADPALMANGALVRDLALTGLVLVFHFLSTEPSTVERPRLWRSLLMAALFAWTSFALLDAGPEAWRMPAWRALEVAIVLWVVLDLFASGWATLRWKAVLRDFLILGPISWLIFHVLGDGPAMLGWGTIIRDVSMALPALFMVVYGPAES